MGSFREARLGELPTWLDDEIGQGMQSAPGAMQDAELRLLKDGVLARFLADAPDDALDRIGSTMRLPRFLKESNDHYRARLDVAWETHELRGTPQGVTGILTDMQIVDVDIREDWQWTGALGNWFSRFWPVVGPDFGPVLQTLGLTTPFETGEAFSTTTGGGTTMGSTATRAEILQMRREVLNWKHPASVPIHLIMAFDGAAIQGLVSTPFTTLPGGAAYYGIGKFQGVTVFSAPFVPGGFLE